MTAARLRQAALAAYFALLALLLVWLVWLSPPRAAAMSLALLLTVGPLLLPLRGLLRARRYTFAWSTLLILLYFVHGVVAAANPGIERLLGLAEIVLSLAYFGLAIGYVRASNPARRRPTDSSA